VVADRAAVAQGRAPGSDVQAVRGWMAARRCAGSWSCSTPVSRGSSRLSSWGSGRGLPAGASCGTGMRPESDADMQSLRLGRAASGPCAIPPCVGRPAAEGSSADTPISQRPPRENLRGRCKRLTGAAKARGNSPDQRHRPVATESADPGGRPAPPSPTVGRPESAATHVPPSPSGGYSPSVTPQPGTGLPWWACRLPTTRADAGGRRAQLQPDRAARPERHHLSAMCPQPRSTITATHPAPHPCGGAPGADPLSCRGRTHLVYGRLSGLRCCSPAYGSPCLHRGTSEGLSLLLE